MFATIAYFKKDGELVCGGTLFPTDDDMRTAKENYISENGEYGYWHTHSECGFTVRDRYHWVGNPTEEQKEQLLKAVEDYYDRV